MYLATLLHTHPGSRKAVSALIEAATDRPESDDFINLRLRMLEKHIWVAADTTRKQAMCDGGILLVLLIAGLHRKRAGRKLPKGKCQKGE